MSVSMAHWLACPEEIKLLRSEVVFHWSLVTRDAPVRSLEPNYGSDLYRGRTAMDGATTAVARMCSQRCQRVSNHLIRCLD